MSSPLRTVAPWAFVALAMVKLVARFPIGPDYQDVGSFLASGDLYNRGLNPYGVPDLADITISGINFNPPLLLGTFGALARLPWEGVRVGLFAVQLAACVAMLLWLRRRYDVPPWKLALLLVLEPVWYGLWVGNIYPLLALLVLLARVTSERRPLMAGALIGALCAIKPNLLLWPLLLLVAGELGTALVAIGVAGGLTLAAGVTYGFGTYTLWLTAITRWRWAVDAATDLSLQGTARFLGYPALAAVPCLLVLGASLWAARRASAARAGEIAILTALLVSPVAWVGYLLLIYPWLVDRPWRPPTLVAMALLVPASMLQLPGLDLVFPPMGLYTLAALLLLADAAGSNHHSDSDSRRP